MLSHTRVSTSPDIARMAAALSRPGIDPRTWCSLAVVDAVSFEAEHGYLVDVMLIGSDGAGAIYPARVAAAYAGPGFGFFLPLEVDDEVVVVFSGGDPAAGLLIVGRTHDAGTPPPAEVADHQTDLLLLAKEGATVRIATQGGGNVIIEPRGSGEVHLGAEDAEHRVIQGDVFDSSVATPISAAIDTAVAGFPAALTVQALETVLSTLLTAIKVALAKVPSTYSPNVRVK